MRPNTCTNAPISNQQPIDTSIFYYAHSRNVRDQSQSCIVTDTIQMHMNKCVPPKLPDQSPSGQLIPRTDNSRTEFLSGLRTSPNVCYSYSAANDRSQLGSKQVYETVIFVHIFHSICVHLGNRCRNYSTASSVGNSAHVNHFCI